MKFKQAVTLKEIAGILSCEFVGNPDALVLGMNEIHKVTSGDIVFVDHPKYYDKALSSAATFILINKEVDCPEGKGLLVSQEPFDDFNRLTNYFRSFQKSDSPISQTAIIGEDSIVQPNVFIGHNVVIGKNCLIHANVSIGNDTVIGDNVIIHGGTTLGGDAFYYKKRPDGFHKLISSGRVVLGNDVEIGAGCTIDRGVSGDTSIGNGTKIDNMVHIGHDVEIGEKCLFAAQVGIAGATVIEDEVTLWGQVGITSGITIGKGAVILAQSGVSKSLAGNTTYFGSPAEEAKKKMKELAMIKQIPSIIKRLD